MVASNDVAAWLAGALLLVTGCYTTANHGLGNCKEYHPFCAVGNEVCTHDNRGCEVCTCSCGGGVCDQHGQSAGSDERIESGSPPVWGPGR